ncbi:aldehyde dehydrogenase family protein [Polynucleobacter paneuropaeus]|nr:aldehyde dehydrogenase family protein [Polynucleobacter paneuropaeus]MBT8605124.1 aldehyde dehydrogenase family protein [Polynucleobacter paneuropaeus]MBT8610634.1 aldehyde dehydrogenase family protein [Polynucleobacter paneuropaeus]QWC97319.1 aldehyde dehydrogenase family protein [Polynucleobacter paneuropaeus]
MNRFTLQLEEIKTAYTAEPNPSLEIRLERIRKIEQMIAANEDKICKALEADFGFRHPMETRLAEFGMIYQACKHTSKHLKEWMKPTQVEAPGFLGSSQAWIETQSIGVVGILSPWNYPIQLALLPAIAAIAAGNRVWLKTSERSSRTSGFLAGLIQEYFHPTEFCVSTGGPDVAEIFASLPFDHLFFTGSEVIAKKVMRSAAENLTPVTLELGGKSPAVIDSSAKLADAAASIVYGKLINAGQTCIAPDYVLLQQGQLDPFVAELKQAAQKQYSADTQLTGPIDENQLARWKFLVEDAVTRGAQVIPLLTEVENENFMPVALLNVSKDAVVMQEEIFGPILPIVVIEDINAAITYVNSKPNPLALYWFGRDNKNQVRWISETRSGGMTINDTLLHAAVETLPFGGIGASGMGAYRGKTGFDTLSHQKSVLEVHSFLGIKMFKGTNMARPPYGKKTEFLLRLLK